MDPFTLVLFGATGDLAARKIFPALFRLFAQDKLKQGFSVVGVGRRAWSDLQLRAHVKDVLMPTLQDNPLSPDKLEAFLKRIHYCRIDVQDQQDYGRLLEIVQKAEEGRVSPNRIFYLSVAPLLYTRITAGIAASGLDKSMGWKRLVVEKPFGRDLQSARLLNQRLREVFREEEIYRIDHYLGKPMVQSLGVLRYANPLIQAIWNKDYIASVQITASEKVGVEGRAGYYEQAGALRDMLQNHLLQLVMMTAMRVDKQMGTEELHQAKREILESIRPLSPDEVARHVVRGQYTSGRIDGLHVPGYQEEPGVAHGSLTETYIAARLMIDHPMWQGVPFYLRTGKRMKEKATRIVIECKNPGEQIRQVHEQPAPNLLVVHISPEEGLALQLNQTTGGEGASGTIIPVQTGIPYSGQERMPEAYELLLGCAIAGDATHFARWEEVELSWKWVEPIIEAFAKQQLPLHPYPAGSLGPEAAGEMLAEDGFHWWMDAEERKSVLSTV
jgi:glucose-6-phosphate 1-dehydrogenase